MANNSNAQLIAFHIVFDRGSWRIRDYLGFTAKIRKQIPDDAYREWRAGGNPPKIQEWQETLTKYSLKLVPAGESRVMVTSL